MTTTTSAADGSCEGAAPAPVAGAAGGQRGPVPPANGGAQLGFPRPTLLMDVVSDLIFYFI